MPAKSIAELLINLFGLHLRKLLHFANLLQDSTKLLSQAGEMFCLFVCFLTILRAMAKWVEELRIHVQN